MSKYRKGAMYIRNLKPTDKANDVQTTIRLKIFCDPNNWKNPERVKPVVMIQYGIGSVTAVWMNREEAIRSLLVYIPKRRRNAKHCPMRGSASLKVI